jgi:hypothetical protein
MKSAFLALVLGAAMTSAALGAEQAIVETPLRDPWVPPETKRAAVPAPETQGEALRAQVERKLRASFDAADVEGRGSLTRDQAQRGGLGFIAKHFDRIDTGHTGRVTVDGYLNYLRAQGARL